MNCRLDVSLGCLGNPDTNGIHKLSPQHYTGDSQEILGVEKGARELPHGIGGGQGTMGERNIALSISPGLSFQQSKNP